jgi:hypothetical protein
VVEDVGQDGPILAFGESPRRIGRHHLPDVVEEASGRAIPLDPRIRADEGAADFPLALLTVTAGAPLLIDRLAPGHLILGLCLGRHDGEASPTPDPRALVASRAVSARPLANPDLKARHHIA